MFTLKKHRDLRLVKKLIKGDEQAFSHFFHDYFPRLFQFALSRVGRDEDIAEEAVQAALSKAVQKLSSYRGEAALFTWLCTFCRHEISAILKRENKLGEKVELVDDSDYVSAALASMANIIAHDPLQAYQRFELAEIVNTAKAYIPSLYSDVLELKYINGYSVKEIAEKIWRSDKATES